MSWTTNDLENMLDHTHQISIASVHFSSIETLTRKDTGKMKHNAEKLSGLKARSGQLVRLDYLMTMMGSTEINEILQL